MATIAEALAIAIQHHQKGQLQAAEKIYQQILAYEPEHAEALHLLGVIALQLGKHEVAAQQIRRAVELNGTDPAFHDNLGSALSAQGKLDEAIASFRRALELKPDYAEAHYNLGTVFQAQGNLNEAIRSFRRALELKPDLTEAYNNLGAVFQAQGKLEEAVSSFRRALEQRPDFVEARSNLGNVFQAQGKLDEAIACHRRALELKPDFLEASTNLGAVLQAQGKLEEAASSFRRALELNPGDAEALSNLGNVFQAQGKLDEAIACFRRALELKPDHAEAHFNLGNALQAQGKLDEAVSCIRRALERKPDYAEAHFNLGTAFQTQGKLQEAVACFRTALEQKPNLPEAHNSLGIAFQAQGKPDEAVASYLRALELKPDYARAHYNLGIAFQQFGRFDDALMSFSRALELRPDYREAHLGRSMLRLLLGDFHRGWPEYEWRWNTGQLKEREFSQPRWDGKPLEERTILLHAEQGIGDTLQFVRYAALVKEQNASATVVVECQRALAKLLARCPGIDRLIAVGDELLPFDLHSPLLSLPGILKTTVETIPAEVPYLFADPALVAHWRERLRELVGTAHPTELGGFNGLRIGVNWQGRPGQGEFRKRDIPPEIFARLAQVPGVTLVSLQKGEGREELAARVQKMVGGAHPTIVDLGDDFDMVHGAFMDTAAVMMNLDLVITSDTAVPHLAGALSVPVWLALPFVPDWRWLLDRSDSPWYPTLRLFRQKRAGDWEGVFEEMEVALVERLRG